MATKIYIDCSVFEAAKTSGIAYATKQFILALCQADELRANQIILLITKNTQLPDEIAANKRLKLKKLPFSARAMRLMARLPITLPLDILTGKGYYIFPNFYNLPLSFSKSITFVHDVAYLIYPDTVQEKNLRFLNANMSRWVRRTDVVATLSESSKHDIVSRLDLKPSKIIVVNVPLAEEYLSFSKSIDETLTKYQLPKTYVLYVGNIEPRKNLERLIKAYANSRIGKEQSLLLVGADKWKATSIEQAINRAQASKITIVFPKTFVSDEDMPAIIAKASFLVQPSIYEGFGIAPTQAAACGTPILVSDIPVMHEVLGSAAKYFDPQDEADMTNQIDDMAELVKTKKYLDEYKLSANAVVNKLKPLSATAELIQQLTVKI